MKKFIVLTLTIAFSLSLFGCKNESQKSMAQYDINLTLFEDMTVDGNMTYTFNSPSNITAVYFSLYPNAFSQTAEISPVYSSDELSAYPNGKSYGHVEVKCAKAFGREMEFQTTGINQNTLVVGLDKTVESGERVEVYLEFKVILPNVKHRTGYGDNTVNLTNFYPVACVYENGDFYKNVYYPSGDPFYTECSNYKVSLTVPSEYSIASSLSPISTEWSGGNTKYSYQRNSVRDVAFILSKNYKIIEKSCKETTVKYYYFNDKNPEKTIETACNALSFFSDKYLKYPYAEYVVAEADFLYGGMEYPCLSLISNEISDDYRDYVVAHETAHQWFYGILGVNQNEIGYFDEGLTELSTALFLSEYLGVKIENYINQTVSSYLSIKEALAYSGNTLAPVMERNLKDFSSEAEYVMIAYNRSQIMFYEILKTLGEGKFYKFMKNFIKTNAYKNVTANDFCKSLEKTSKTAKKIFNSYVNGEEVIKKVG